MATRLTVAVGAVIVRSDARVLLVRRSRPPLAGSWSLPGGRVERGEPLERAVVREALEETGLHVSLSAPLGVVRVAREGFRYDIHEFLCSLEVPQEVARAGDDAADILWASVEELSGLGVWRSAIAVVQRALRLVTEGRPRDD